MRKRICFIVIIALTMCMLNPLFSAEEVVEFENTICPVSGEKIIEGEVVQYEYDGTIYNLCCKMCAKDFGKDPEKYIAILEKQKKLEEENEQEKESDIHDH